MKRLALLGLASVIALATVGCNLQPRISGHSAGFTAPRHAPTYALAVTVQGSLQPTPQQWAAIQAKVADELSWRGGVLVSDLALAEHIIRLDFRPNPSNPENSGHLTLLGIRVNPYYGTARSGILASAYQPYNPFSSYRYLNSWGSSSFYSGDYYNYLGPWENGYTSGSSVAVVTPPPTPKPPHRHDRTDRTWCPPDALHPRPTPTLASTEPTRSLSTGASFAATPVYTSPEPTRARWTGERSAWRSEAALNRPAHTYATSAPTGTRGDRTASRSDRSYSSSDSSSWRSRNDSYRGSSSDYNHHNSYSSSSSSGSLSASSSHVTPAYTSPQPSYSSSSYSSGSMSTSSSSASSSSSSSSSSVTTTESSNTIER